MGPNPKSKIKYCLVILLASLVLELPLPLPLGEDRGEGRLQLGSSLTLALSQRAREITNSIANPKFSASTALPSPTLRGYSNSIAFRASSATRRRW
jgi:hypothetical protein